VACASARKCPPPAGVWVRQDGFVVLVVITGPIASGKSTLGRAVAREFEARGARAAVIDLDLVYEMLDPARAAKTDEAKWAQARRLSARLADALLAEGLEVIVEGDFLTPAARGQFVEVLASRAYPRFVMLRLSFDLALRRAQLDSTRGLSRDRAFLREHYETTAAPVRDAPSTDLVVDTGLLPISEAAHAVAEWTAPS
jgi:predicted kinase